jgi:hypothetical protein
VNWAEWDEELLALELQELQAADYNLEFTGFDVGDIDELLVVPDEEKLEVAPPLPVQAIGCPGDLWLCGPRRVLCEDATSAAAVGRLLGASASRG